MLVKMTIDECIEEFDKLLAEVDTDSPFGNLWGLQIYVYGQSAVSHKKYETELKEHPWRYHIRASYTISSGNAGIFYRTDDPVIGILKIIAYMRENKDKLRDWGVNNQVDLGTP